MANYAAQERWSSGLAPVLAPSAPTLAHSEPALARNLQRLASSGTIVPQRGAAFSLARLAQIERLLTSSAYLPTFQMLQQRDQQLDFNIYGYVPSEAAAIAFIVLFSILTVPHIGLLVRSRMWWMSITIVGGVTEIIGWIGRLKSAQNFASLDSFLVQQVCLVLAPCFFSAALYATLGMFIRLRGTEFSRLRPSLYLVLFCSADLVAIVIQAIGGAMAAISLGDGKESTTGTHIMVAGIAAQLASMIVFSVLAWEYLASERQFSRRGSKGAGGKANLLAFGIAWGSFWILVRCVYRTVELAQGWSGYLLTHQPYFIALDAVPMLLTMAMLVPTHPYICLPAGAVTGPGIELNTEESSKVEVNNP